MTNTGEVIIAAGGDSGGEMKLAGKGEVICKQY
jgi:hypothetical protein